MKLANIAEDLIVGLAVVTAVEQVVGPEAKPGDEADLPPVIVKVNHHHLKLEVKATVMD